MKDRNYKSLFCSQAIPQHSSSGQQYKQDQDHTASTMHHAIFVVKLLTALPQLCTDAL